MSPHSFARLRVVTGLICISTTGVVAAQAAGNTHPKAQLVATQLATHAKSCDASLVQTLNWHHDAICPISAVRSVLNLSELASSDFGDSDDAPN